MTRAIQVGDTGDAGTTPVTRGASERDDVTLPETRWLAAFIVPFLVVAFALLYGWPDDTARLFAWTIRPRMTPMLMGAGYIAGAYFFVRVLAGGAVAVPWHSVTCGFLPVTAFASSMAIATALHWDRFNHAHVSFYAWVFLYVIAPPLVAGVWLRNRRHDPGTLSASDTAVPPVVRWTVGAVGALILVTGACLFLVPSVLIAVWPWTLTPLTARVLGGWFALPGVAGLVLSRDQRWSAWVIPLQSQAVGIVLILIGAVRAWSTFDPAGPGIWLFVGGMGVLLVGILSLYRSMESRPTHDPVAARSPLTLEQADPTELVKPV
jgi:hypothetical protein